MDEKVVVGLDIGSTKVCAVVGRMNAQGTLDVLGLGRADSTGVTKGMVLNVPRTIEAVNRAVEQAGNQSNYDIGSVIVGMAGQHIQCLRKRGSLTRDTPGNEVLVADIERLSNDILREPVAPGNAVLHVLPQEYRVDNWDTPDPVGVTGMRLQADFQVLTSPLLAIENTRKCVERSNLDLDALVLSPLAAAMATLTDDEKEAGVALVDIGGGTTDVVIFHKNIVRHVAILPFAGNVITTDVQQGCNVLPGQAETLKVKYGSALQSAVGLHEVVSVPGMMGRAPKDISRKNLVIIIEQRLKEIAALVCAEFVRSGYDKKLSAGIVLAGGTAQFENIDALFAQVSGKDVRIGSPNQHFGKGKLDVAENPMYATAVGLVWRGFRSLDDREDEYRKVALTEAATLPGNGSNGVRPRGPEPAPKPAPSPRRGFFDLIKGVLNDDIGDKDSYQ
jgi:cell division protein FtsA